MRIHKVIEDSWLKTVQDFEEEKKRGNAWLWKEATLRLCFFRHFCEQAIKIARILAETAFHIGEDDYKPDLVIDTIVNGKLETTVFEIKYFGKNWETDWEKLQKYGVIGWDYGCFLAIGSLSQCDKMPKKVQKDETWGHLYETRALVYPTPRLEYAPYFKIAEGLLKKALSGTPYVILENYGAKAIFKNFIINFDMISKENKCVVWVSIVEGFADEHKLKNIGYDKWLSFDDELRIQPSESFIGNILIGEFDANTYRNNIKKVKDSLDRFREKMKFL